MPPALRLSRDGKWWGRRGYWTNAVSADGTRRWDGTGWARLDAPSVPDCLEALNPGALRVNRAGRMKFGQAMTLAPRLGFAVLFTTSLLGAGCALDLVSLLIGLTLGLLLALLTLPVLLLFLVIEWLLGVRSEEGRLMKVIDGRQKNLWVADTLVAARGKDIKPMVDGAYHRLYFSRMTLSLVNYERLGGAALAAAERAAAAESRVKFGGNDTDVSIWAIDLGAGALPRICVKSGRPATTQLTFRFVTRGLSFWVLGLLAPGRRADGPLPLIRAWRMAFIALRVVAALAAIAGIAGLLTTGAVGASSRATLVLASIVAFGVSLVLFAVYGGLRPKGDVYATETGELFVMLRDVNPRFVDAVSAAGDRAHADLALEQDQRGVDPEHY